MRSPPGPMKKGAPNLSWLADAAPGADTTVQGLADVAVLAAPAASGRHRLALVSVADLPARVLLDELDKHDIVVRRVCSVWHALSLAWDPSAKSAPATDDDRVVSASEPVGAAVVIDPDGRLAWSWSQRGTLIAGGTLLLRKTQTRVGEEPEQIEQPGLRIAGAEPDVPDTRPVVSVIEAARSDIGRLASDWLGWSVQLGVAPARIAVVGPDNVICAGLDFDLPDMMGVAAVGAGLGKHWPGASVHATVDDDAIGRTLQRLTDMENGIGPASAPAAAVDPRLSLTELSSRPGAADRKLHLWAGLALLIAAAGVGVLGWRLGSTVSDVRAKADAASAAQGELLKSVASIAPAALKDADPGLILTSKRIEMEKARADQKDEEPILAEMQRVLSILTRSDVTDVRIKVLQLNSMGISSRLELSLSDKDLGPTIKDLLRDTPSTAPRQIKWDGRGVGNANAERRDYALAGTFVDVPKGAKPPTPPATPAATPAGDKPAGDKSPVSPMLDTGPGAAPSSTEPENSTPGDAAPGGPTPATNPPAAEPTSPATTPPATPPSEPKPAEPKPEQPKSEPPKPAEPKPAEPKTERRP
ncbi:MAG: hypothetical protein QM783_00915 [Phycisphaerales bacterium]